MAILALTAWQTEPLRLSIGTLSRVHSTQYICDTFLGTDVMLYEQERQREKEGNTRKMVKKKEEREGDRETETGRQTDRQTDRQIETEREQGRRN